MHKIYTNNCSSSSRESDSDSEESKEEGRMIIIVQWQRTMASMLICSLMMGTLHQKDI